MELPLRWEMDAVEQIWSLNLDAVAGVDCSANNLRIAKSLETFNTRLGTPSVR